LTAWDGFTTSWEKYPEAVHWLEKAVAADDQPDGVILDHLGDAYWKQDHWKKLSTHGAERPGV
jgi:hypothetical protein